MSLKRHLLAVKPFFSVFFRENVIKRLRRIMFHHTVVKTPTPSGTFYHSADFRSGGKIICFLAMEFASLLHRNSLSFLLTGSEWPAQTLEGPNGMGVIFCVFCSVVSGHSSFTFLDPHHRPTNDPLAWADSRSSKYLIPMVVTFVSLYIQWQHWKWPKVDAKGQIKLPVDWINDPSA